MADPVKILHVTPHLGGGVGKAHAALSGVDDGVARTYLLLEAARDRRYLEMIAANGCEVIETPDTNTQHALVEAADIVQFEFWNHPRMAAFMARDNLPPMRSAVWCHISGLFSPVIPPGLTDMVDKLVLTSPCAFPAKSIAGKDNVAVISSGYGLENSLEKRAGHPNRVCYLGTVDFVKMHPGFFQIIDAVACDIAADVWGAFEQQGAVEAEIAKMRFPGRVHLRGATEDISGALAQASIFLYPLQPQHYGTAENALVEAMSAGLAPVVMNNPAEAAIVQNGETGIIAGTIEQCAIDLEKLLQNPQEAARLGANAQQYAAANCRPEIAAEAFSMLYKTLLEKPKRNHDFASAIGRRPADWFRAFWPDIHLGASGTRPSKGGLAHFLDCFPEDEELKSLAANMRDRLQE